MDKALANVAKIWETEKTALKKELEEVEAKVDILESKFNKQFEANAGGKKRKQPDVPSTLAQSASIIQGLQGFIQQTVQQTMATEERKREQQQNPKKKK